VADCEITPPINDEAIPEVPAVYVAEFPPVPPPPIVTE
jgi:hypothetical protein